MTSRVISVPEVLTYLGHKFLHSLASMIPGDAVMRISPDPFDPIVVGAVGWQEVEFHLATQHLQRKLHLQALIQNPQAARPEGFRFDDLANLSSPVAARGERLGGCPVEHARLTEVESLVSPSVPGA
jgi:hypothetical protein